MFTSNPYQSSLYKQKGASIGGIIFAAGIAIFVGFALVKIAGFYFDNNMVKQSLEELHEVPYITKKSEREVHELIRKKLSMNNIALEKDEVFVDKKADRLLVDVIYERRSNLVSNIDIVVSFENHFEAVRN